MKLLSIYSLNEDIYNHLALEEYLLNHSSSIVFFLWVNSKTVVIGRNQNPWLEININMAREKSISIARRPTGGGAVFHDKGNINYTFILPKEKSHLKNQMKIIQDALAIFNIQCDIGDKNEILYHGLKFSGNAFAYKKNRMIHHGTLLLNTDLELLNLILKTDYIKYIDRSRSVGSNPVKVINLLNINNNLNFKMIFKAIQDKLAEYLHIKVAKTISFKKFQEKLTDTQNNIFNAYQGKYRSDKWIFQKTPNFILKLKLISLDNKTLFLNIKKGKIQDVFLEEEKNIFIMQDIKNLFLGLKLNSSEIIQKLNSKNLKVKSELIQFFRSNYF